MIKDSRDIIGDNLLTGLILLSAKAEMSLRQNCEDNVSATGKLLDETIEDLRTQLQTNKKKLR